MARRAIIDRAGSLLLVTAIATSGCGAASPNVTPDAAAVIERMDTADPTLRWRFTYRPDSPSPYLACLQGIDEITGDVDVAEGVLWLQPHRNAPAIALTERKIAVPDPDSPGSWLAVPWPSTDNETLSNLLGETLAGHAATGLRLPDPNMTVTEILTVASSVETMGTTTPNGSNTLSITVDVERFNNRRSEASDSTADPLEFLTVTAVIDPAGRVTTMIVDASQPVPNEESSPHGDRYIITAEYDDLDPIEAAPRRSTTVSTADLRYPDAQSSCEFTS